MLDRSEVGKRGYLKENFRLFHLRDSRAQKLDYHYHEFDKVILLLSGKVTYVVEGKSYFLKPGDILLVQHNMIHLPEIDPSEPYERIVLWISRDFLSRHSREDGDLANCFQLAARAGHPGALREVGKALIDGRGVKADHAAGLKFLRLASEAGDREAMRIRAAISGADASFQ